MWRQAARRVCVLRRRVAGERPLATSYRAVAAQDEGKGGAPGQEAGGSVPREADVVVVGGGVLGCSCLYHLAKLGVTNTVLLEAHQLTAGTTWHTAGLMYGVARSEVDFLLRKTTRQILKRLEEETGVSSGWINNGALLVSSTANYPAERMDELKRLVTFTRAMDYECDFITPAQVKDIYPLMETSDINCAVYSPNDGQMDPSGLCQGMTRWATRAGAQVVEGCPVTGIRTTETLLGGRRVAEVFTPRGAVKTSALINATGGWGNTIAAMIGVTLPLQSFRHCYVVTDTIPGVAGVPNVRDYTSSCYIKMQGDSLTVGSFEPNPDPIDELDPNFPFGLYEMNWNMFGPMYNKVVQRIPALAEVGIKSTVVGPESFTPDGQPVLGEDPNVQGFFHCCGFNSHGMQHSGGCGDQLAKWIVKGEPELDLFFMDIRRFHPPLAKNKPWVLARSQESLSSNYSVKFPHDDPLAGRGQRLSPLHQVLEAAGCVFQERNGWERPGWFHSTPVPVLPYDWYGAYEHTPPHADHPYYNLLTQDYTFGFPAHHHVIQRECMACRERVAVFDMSCFGKYFLSGPDAQKAADWLFSADMARPAGSTVYTCMLNERGGVEADLTVSVCEGGDGTPCNPSFEGRWFYITTGGATAGYVAGHILKEARKQGWRITLQDHTENLALLSVQGPHSKDVLQQLTPDDLGNASFPFSSHRIVTFGGHTLRALRLSFPGELGWELHAPRDSALSVYRSVMAAGEPLNIVNAGFRALDSLSCEKGYRHWHSDVTPEDTPLEAGLAFTCKLTSQTDFKGRAALERQRAEGVSKQLVTMTLDGDPRPLWGHEGIVRDGLMVGYTRRAEWAFTLGRGIAYGYVRRPNGEPVTEEFLNSGTWQLEVMGERLPATLHISPPFDPLNLRLKGIYKQE